MRRGRFITLEGGEGTGKSTQAELLARFLEQHDCEVVVTREPGGAAGSEEIRALLVTGDADRWSPLAELLLMNAAREDHLRRVIRPALERGAWVVCDRFADSSRAYQGIVGGVELEIVEMIERAVVGATMPDLTLVLDIDADAGLLRTSSRADTKGHEDRFERKGRAFHAALREAFLQIARTETARCVVIDATGPVDAVATSIARTVQQRLLDPGTRQGTEMPGG